MGLMVTKGSDSPTALTALTLNSYWLPVSRSLISTVVDEDAPTWGVTRFQNLTNTTISGHFLTLVQAPSVPHSLFSTWYSTSDPPLSCGKVLQSENNTKVYKHLPFTFDAAQTKLQPVLCAFTTSRRDSGLDGGLWTLMGTVEVVLDKNRKFYILMNLKSGASMVPAKSICCHTS